MKPTRVAILWNPLRPFNGLRGTIEYSLIEWANRSAGYVAEKIALGYDG
jgi:hypothetical protein